MYLSICIKTVRGLVAFMWSRKQNPSCRHPTFSGILIILMLVMGILRQSTCWEVFLTQFLRLMSESAPAKFHIWERSMWQPSAKWKSQGKYSSIPLLTRCWYLHHYVKPGLGCVPDIGSNRLFSTHTCSLLSPCCTVCMRAWDDFDCLLPLACFHLSNMISDILYICFSVRKTETLGQF